LEFLLARPERFALPFPSFLSLVFFSGASALLTEAGRRIPKHTIKIIIISRKFSAHHKTISDRNYGEGGGGGGVELILIAHCRRSGGIEFASAVFRLPPESDWTCNLQSFRRKTNSAEKIR
jgi:hypothetical protein